MVLWSFVLGDNWPLQWQLLCPVLCVLEHSRGTFEVSFLRAWENSPLCLPWVQWSWLVSTWPSHPSQRLFMRRKQSNKAGSSSLVQWSWKGQSRSALLTGSDIPITFSPLHHSLSGCTHWRCQESHFTITSLTWILTWSERSLTKGTRNLIAKAQCDNHPKGKKGTGSSLHALFPFPSTPPSLSVHFM